MDDAVADAIEADIVLPESSVKPSIKMPGTLANILGLAQDACKGRSSWGSGKFHGLSSSNRATPSCSTRPWSRSKRRSFLRQ